jgi:hypothetical protein
MQTRDRIAPHREDLSPNARLRAAPVGAARTLNDFRHPIGRQSLRGEVRVKPAWMSETFKGRTRQCQKD